MPRNGSGTYSLSQTSFTTGTTISSTAMNSNFNDIASALTASLCTDGQSSMTGTVKGYAGSASAPGFAFASDSTTGLYSSSAGVIGFSSSGSVKGLLTSSGFSTATSVALQTPIGAIMDYGGTSAPSGWLFCNNQAVSRTTYASLFAIIGTTYGAGDASNTFNVPDCRDRVLAGNDVMGNAAASRLTTGVSGVNGAANGASGGAQSTSNTISQANLPNVNLSVANITLTAAGSTAKAGNATNSADGVAFSTVQNIGDIVVGGNVPLGGSGTALTIIDVQPTLITYKMIYAGV